MSPSELIGLLLDPDCYPHRTREIRVVETHISWVVLTGSVAYKIKKPVRFSFIDFSTLERRRYFCEEELRLNRRFAPALYLGISRVSRCDGRIRIDAADDGATVVEYAVRLRQFERSSELTQLIARDAVDAPRLRTFGRDLGEVHAQAPRASDRTEHGSVETIRRTVADNLSDLDAIELTETDRRSVASISNTIHGRGQALAPLMQARRQQGRIRECHGDLHAGNIVMLDDRLVAFDCLEFDPALRFIDVVSDAAFLYMDLRTRRRSDLAYSFLDGWLERTGDHAGIELLSYYSAYRALVRAKVIVLAASARGKGAIDPDMRAKKTTYLELASSLLALRCPVLIVMTGMSGSGKSWLSRQLIAALPAIRIQSDVERKRLAGLAPDAVTRSSTAAGIYTPEFNARTYRRMIDCARHVLRGGENAILDAAFLKRSERTAAFELAAELGARCLLVSCTAPLEVLRRRITERLARGTDPSEATLEVLERQQNYLEPFTEFEQQSLVTIDTSAPDPERPVLEAIAERSR